MTKALVSYASSRNNNFNLIRFVAASLVIFSHSFAIVYGTGNAEPLRSSLGMTWGTIAVDIFFITSGFLVTSSYFNRRNIIHFLWARVLRIYPALVVAILFCVIIIGWWFTVLHTHEYFTNSQTLLFFLKNITLVLGHESTLPGVFLNVPLKHPINGSLWTLPYEIKMYAILATLLFFLTFKAFWSDLFSVKKVTLSIIILALALNIYNHFHPLFTTPFIRLFSMFFLGVSFFVFKDYIFLSTRYFYLMLLILLISTFNSDIFFVLYSISIPYIILYLAYVPSGVVRHFNEWGDYSYGLYIYAFPIQQTLIASFTNISVVPLILLSFAITLFLAAISWHLIEKPFLLFKK